MKKKIILTILIWAALGVLLLLTLSGCASTKETTTNTDKESTTTVTTKDVSYPVPAINDSLTAEQIDTVGVETWYGDKVVGKDTVIKVTIKHSSGKKLDVNVSVKPPDVKVPQTTITKETTTNNSISKVDKESIWNKIQNSITYIIIGAVILIALFIIGKVKGLFNLFKL